MQAMLVVTTICQIINIKEAATAKPLEKNMFRKPKKTDVLRNLNMRWERLTSTCFNEARTRHL